MNRTTLARRYAPLLAVVAIQLLIIAVVPSTAPTQQVSAGADAGDVGAGDLGTGDAGVGSTETTLASGEAGTGVGGTGVTVPGGGTGGGTSGASGSAGSTAGGTGGTKSTVTTPGGGAGGASGPVGDISHCKSGKQFDPALDHYAPPCTGKFTGKNPGATYQGVTDTEIKVVYYYGRGSDAVDTILKAQGAYVEAATLQNFYNVQADFLNKHYEFYGRKIKVEVVQGQCPTIPPDYRCLRNEARQIIADKKPFAVLWNASLASPFFAELSAGKTINIGGWNFRDQFGQAFSPYHYDVQMSGTQLAKHFGELWCAQLNGKPPIYAGSDVIKAKPARVLGVLATNDPENKKTVDDLKAAMGKCGGTVAHEFYYAQDISTADQQRRAAVAKMRENPESTTVLCLCDLVAPAFLYQTQEEQRYYPENMIAGTGFMDADKAARSYDTLLPSDPTCQCNNQFVNAFGLSSIAPQENYDKGEDYASRFWRNMGKGNKAPFDSGTAYGEYLALLGTMVQQAGPTLTPQTVAAGMSKTPQVGGSRLGRSVNPSKGDYSWNDNMRMVYWSPTRPSSFDGKAGSYVDMFPGKRFELGQYPAGDLVLPPKQGRGRP